MATYYYLLLICLRSTYLFNYFFLFTTSYVLNSFLIFIFLPFKSAVTVNSFLIFAHLLFLCWTHCYLLLVCYSSTCLFNLFFFCPQMITFWILSSFWFSLLSIFLLLKIHLWYLPFCSLSVLLSTCLFIVNLPHSAVLVICSLLFLTGTFYLLCAI